MCAVSAVFDYGQRQWPADRTPNPLEWESYKELIDKAKWFDVLTEQPECEDPSKLDWFQKMDKRVEEARRTGDH